MLIRIKCPSIFQVVSFPSTNWKHKGIFLCDSLWELVELQEIKLTQWLSLPGIFISQSFLNWTSSNLSITVQVFLPRHWFLNCHSLYSLCPQCGGQQFGLWPLVSYRNKNSLFFRCSAFYLLIGWSGRFLSSLHVSLETKSTWNQFI